MKTVLYGGAFNPPHTGHLDVLNRLAGKYDKVIVMPSGQAPHKAIEGHSPEVRLGMVRTLAYPFANAGVSDYECSRAEVSYTVDTLEYLKGTYPDLTLAMGEDMYAAFPQWKDAERIRGLAAIEVFPRRVDMSSTRLRRERKPRAEHIIGTAEYAVKLAALNGADTRRACMAGLLHDCTKLWSAEEHLTYARKYDIILDGTPEKLLHAYTGALYARELFGIDDEMYDAIYFHTTARENMTTLDKIAYVADKLEERTRDYADLPRLRELVLSDLDAAAAEIRNITLNKLKERGNE